MDMHNYDVHELERRAGLKKNNIYNILKGTSKKPSAQTIHSIANVFGIKIEDILGAEIAEPGYLDNSDLTLIADVTACVVKEIAKIDLQVTNTEIINIIQESFNYSLSSGIKEPDSRFISWLLVQKYQKRNITF